MEYKVVSIFPTINRATFKEEYNADPEKPCHAEGTLRAVSKISAMMNVRHEGLLGAEATAHNIRDCLESLGRNQNLCCYIFMHCHGSFMIMPWRKYYWFQTFDTYVEEVSGIRHKLRTALTEDDISGALYRSKAKMLIVVDSCYSGAAYTTLGRDGMSHDNELWSAVKRSEESFSCPSTGAHFTNYLSQEWGRKRYTTIFKNAQKAYHDWGIRGFKVRATPTVPEHMEHPPIHPQRFFSKMNNYFATQICVPQ